MRKNQNPYQPQNGQQGYGAPQQSPYGQYYNAPAKKKLNPMLIVILAAGAIIIALIITLIVILTGRNDNKSNSGFVGGGSNLSSGNHGGESNGSGNGGSDSGSDDGAEDDYGIEYFDNGNPIFIEQTLNNSSLTAYNSRNPYDISINIYAAGNANKLAAVETEDKKKIKQLLLSNMEYDNFDDSVDFIIGEPLKVTYKQQELLSEYKVTFSLPDSLIESPRHYPSVFEGMNRFVVFYVDENDEMVVDGGDVLESSYGSMTVNGHDGGPYLVMIDGDALYYAFGIDPELLGYDDDIGSDSSEPAPSTPSVPETITIAGETYRTDMTGTLDLTGKGLYDNDIEDLRYMTNLSEIILTDNNLIEPTVLGELINLKKLTLHNNLLFNIDFVSNLTNLEVFAAGNNMIKDISPLANMKGLKELWMQDNVIVDVSPLKNHTRLEYVSFQNNYISDFTPLAGNKLRDLHMNKQNGVINGNYDAVKGLTIYDNLYITEGNGFNNADELRDYLDNNVYSDEDRFNIY